MRIGNVPWMVVLALTSACGLVTVKTSSNTSSPGSESTSTSKGDSSTASKGVDKTKERKPPKAGEDCRWFPSLALKMHEGGGKYGPVEAGKLRSDIYHQVVDAYSKKSGLGSNVACETVADLESDAKLLDVVRDGTKHPDSYLAAHYLPGDKWTVDRENGQPVSKSRIVIVYKKKRWECEPWCY